uniref:Secreted protein n=1 Tax=Heterorhabditis bacteriophora TaxID=37862 RepID=A0A1I7WA39_HETBA
MVWSRICEWQSVIMRAALIRVVLAFFVCLSKHRRSKYISQYLELGLNIGLTIWESTIIQSKIEKLPCTREQLRNELVFVRRSHMANNALHFTRNRSPLARGHVTTAYVFFIYRILYCSCVMTIMLLSVYLYTINIIIIIVSCYDEIRGYHRCTKVIETTA